MTDETTRVFDHYLQEFDTIRDRFLASDAGSAQELADLCEEKACRLMALASVNGGRQVTAALHAHPLHRDIIMQSSILKHALDKPRGYAGDMDLMLKICQAEVGPGAGFADHLNAFYADVPASQAVRDRVGMLERLLDDLPAGSRVLNLACGPALEVQSHFRRRPDSTLVVDLVDHDVHTLRYLRGRVPSQRVSLLRGNALRLLAGDLRLHPLDQDEGEAQHERVLVPGYDLIYSAGLYDYIPDGQGGKGGVTALTTVLFSLLKPGGLLLVGNYLRPSPTSKHRPHHRAIMELYCNWHLRYRDMDQIRGFAAAITAPHTIDLLDETGHALRSAEESVIGFAAIRAGSSRGPRGAAPRARRVLSGARHA